jgi:hydroxymethylpyrimidine pyrophosphatase-like HAD family hydrolase
MSTLIVALVTPETEVLAAKTIKLIPDVVPYIVIQTKLDGPSGTIELFIQSLYWSLEVSKQLEIDPGNPSVPQFGRKLFHLSPISSRITKTVSTPVKRKIRSLGTRTDSICRIYTQGYISFKSSLESAEIGAVILDFDGTIVIQSERFDPIPSDIALAIKRILDFGIPIGFATGRGSSIRSALREALPQDKWNKIHIGYYNGAELGLLSDNSIPCKIQSQSGILHSVFQVIIDDQILSSLVQVKERPDQLTVTYSGVSSMMIYTYIKALLHETRIEGIKLLVSGHSIDIVEDSTSKMAVVNNLIALVNPLSVLCIGDQGSWPGNDFEMLCHSYSLSVDMVSSDIHSCWNLAPQGCIGPCATLLYLNALENKSGAVYLDINAIK